MAPHHPPQIAFLGMGAMGQAISKNLVKNGKLEKPILLWNRTSVAATKHAEKLGSDHAEAVESLGEVVARADLIWSCVAGQDAVLSIYETILARDSLHGKLFVESSTFKTEASDELAKKVQAKGGDFVAMPMFGEPSLADKAQLVAVPAGQSESVERVLPYLQGVTAKAVVNMSGQATSMASKLKLVGNILIVALIEAVAEAHVLAEKSDLSPAYVDQTIQAVWPGPMAIYSDRMISGGYYKDEPIANIAMAKGVAAHVLTMARTSGTDITGYRVGVGRYPVIEAHAGKTGDITGIYGALRMANGLKYEN